MYFLLVSYLERLPETAFENYRSAGFSGLPKLLTFTLATGGNIFLIPLLMHSGRPKLQLPKPPFDLVLELTSLIILIFLWIHLINSAPALPERIPIHYGLNGEADRYGSKATIWVLPSICTIIFIGLSLLNKYFLFRYNSPATEENAARQYMNVTRLFRIINFIIVLSFTYLTVKIINGAHKAHSTLGWWFIPALLLATSLPAIYYAIQATKMNRSENK